MCPNAFLYEPFYWGEYLPWEHKDFMKMKKTHEEHIKLMVRSPRVSQYVINAVQWVFLIIENPLKLWAFSASMKYE